MTETDIRIGRRIRAIRESIGMSQDELAQKTGYKSRSSVNKIEMGAQGLTQSKLLLFAAALQTTPGELIERSVESEEPQIPQLPNISPITKKRIPFLGQIACGEPRFCNEDRESYVMAGADGRAGFCLKARGDSMTGARIMDGDIVFIRKDAEIVNGQIYAVEIDDEATLKRVYYDEAAQELRLLAENPKYPTMVYSGERLAHVHVLGKAIAFQSDVI